MQKYIALQKVIELGSFTKAADTLEFTQSSISQMIASLESELNMKLLIRSRAEIKLTREGKELYPWIERSISSYKVMLEKSKEITGLETGIIRIGTVSSVTCHWMPGLMKSFQAIYPNVQFVLHQGDYTSIIDWIKSGEVDFGFINPKSTTDLITVEIKTGDMLAILPENHPLAKKAVIPLRKLAKEPYILLEEGHYSEPMTAFQSIGIEPDIQYTIHDDYAIMTMVEAGLGVSILAALVLLHTNYRIVQLPTDPPIQRTLSIAYKDKAFLPIASKKFIRYILDHTDTLQ